MGLSDNSPVGLEVPHATDMPELSIVVPAFNEQDNVERLHDELVEVLATLDISWEVIFCDDGSSDDTWKNIENLHASDPRIKGVRLSRNFGHQYALLAALTHSQGRAVISMDADLQHPPEVIPKLIEQWRKGARIVHTMRRDPETLSLFKRITSKLYYRLFSYLSGVAIESGMADFRMLDRRVLDEILHFPEAGIFLRGIVQWVGFQSAVVEYSPRDRFSGTPKYTLVKMLRLAWTGITSFSVVPLHLAIVLGIFTSLMAFGDIAYAFYCKLFTEKVQQGWASAVSIMSFLFGVMFILVGIVGEYIGRILIETRQRPRFLVSDHLGVEHTPDRSVVR